MWLCIVCVFSERETERDTMRENRGYYNESVVGCVSSFCWIIERKDWLFGVDVAQTGWTTYICVSLVLCVSCACIFRIFYVLHCSITYIFSTKLQFQHHFNRFLCNPIFYPIGFRVEFVLKWSIWSCWIHERILCPMAYESDTFKII